MASTKSAITTQKGHQDKSIVILFRRGKNRFYSIIFSERTEICFRIIILLRARSINLIHEEVSHYYRNSGIHYYPTRYNNPIFYAQANEVGKP